ncbi:acyltransferase family protein [Xylocopilactobacillus apicola]|uniref:Acyltransferase n=1 Tax=Xylocopilactobacillus apicola TaxID=2932184 RepID=A0AAU9DA35_9LACO|nr:acyltransferase family protein [Xylocopilactobacillus apicola]BDR59240.1 acyltransferase [Xylocopilactobacillus apicola]
MGQKARSTKRTNGVSTYITGFDGLRTIGVLLIIFYHLNPQIFPGGYLGVPIFMVLSGYLITGSLIREVQRTHHIDYRAFFIRRAKRLYPALVTMLLASSSYILLFQRNLLAKLWQIVLTNLSYLYNWWQIFNGQSYFERFADNESPFTHLWTLSIEGQFYLIWPLVIFLLYKLLKTNGKRSLVVLGLAVLSALEMALLYSSANINRVYYGTDTRAFSILLGSALAFVWPVNRLNPNLKRESRILIDSVGAIAALGMLGMIFTVRDQSSGLYHYGMLIFSALATVLVAVIAHPGASFNRILTTRTGSFLGKISYGIYIYQFPVLIFFESKVKLIAKHPFLYSIVELFIIFVISAFSYYFIEQYFAKITWSNFQADLKDILVFKGQKGLKLRGKIGLWILAPLVLLGVSSNVYSVFAKVQNPNDTALARKIKKNAAAQKVHNQLAEKNAQKANREAKQLQKNQERSRSVSRSTRRALTFAAKKNPVNQEYEKYGLTQFELQLAQRTNLTAIGDSVMLDGQADLTKIFPKIVIDAVVSRQASSLPDLLKKKAEQGVIASTIVIGLGTNGTLTPDLIEQAMQIATAERDVFWITDHVPTRSWQDSNNAVIMQEAKKYPNMHIIDWHQHVGNHRDWLYDDLTHPTPTGAVQYGTFIAKEILQFLEQK